eukprot:m.5734 g.5734  ORF g.5734 m.5734 type:complete len:203 (+) comp13982_c0_seq1:40-648(+)
MSEKVLKLITKKESVELEIKELLEVLESQKGVGMNGPLVDQEGFPRADIDVYSIRIARNKIIRLKNDHKSIMSEIESGLHEIHAQDREKESVEDKQKGDESGGSFVKPFLDVNVVSENSPASLSGLKVGDQVVEFGSINESNFKSLQDIGELVKNSEGRKMWIKVVRNTGELRLGLVPKKWQGRGLLGCNIVPLAKESTRQK